MSAPILWIILPFAASLGLFFLQRRTRLTASIAGLLCLVLAGTAWLMPIDRAVRLGPLVLDLESALNIAGRQLVISDNMRPLLVFVFIMSAFWFVGSPAAGGSRLLAPLGLGMVALLLAALAVKPVLYAALLIETAVLLSIPLIAPPHSRPGLGVQRYLIFQSMALPFILLAGWALSGVEANPSDTNLVALSGVFLGLGFACWLAVFPFYTWMLLLGEQTHPYTIGFIFLFLPTVCLLLGLDFLNAYGWLRSNPLLPQVLRLSGLLMVVTAGVWAAFQRHLGRLMGYAAIIETGFSLLALSLGNQIGQEIFMMMLLPRVVSFGLWALSTSIFLKQAPSLKFDDLERVAEKLPAASAGLAAAYFSLSGLPLLADFPLRQSLLEEIAVKSPTTAIWVLVGTVGMMFGGFRLLAVLTGGYFGARKMSESRVQVIFLVIGIVGLLGIGLFPRTVLPQMAGLLLGFGGLK